MQQEPTLDPLVRRSAELRRAPTVKGRSAGPQARPYPQKACPNCLAVIPLDALVCQACQHEAHTAQEVELLWRRHLRDVAREKWPRIMQHLPLMWGLIATVAILVIVGALVTAATHTQLPATQDQRTAVMAAASREAIDAPSRALEAKNQSRGEEGALLSRLKEPAKHQAVQLQAGNSQAFYVYGVGTIKDSWTSLSRRTAPTRIKLAIVGEAAVLGAEVRDAKLWLTGHRQGSSRLIVLDDTGHELYDGTVYVY
jgi:hypothetical protein